MSEKNFYWDSNVFLAYLNEEPDRIVAIENCWKEVARKKGKIFTSTVSITEVAHANYEKLTSQLDPAIEEKINDMWNDETILLVEVNVYIASLAKDYIRSTIDNQWGKLTSKDAIHLATANWIDRYARKIDEFHTYDVRLNRYSSYIGMPINEPFLLQPPLLHEE